MNPTAASLSSPARRRVRLFFALWPAPRFAAQVSREMPVLLKAWGGRAVRQDQLHLTLRFIGPVEEEVQTCLTQAADQVHASPFTLMLDSVCYQARPKILWAAPRITPESLNELALQLEQLCRECGLAAQDRGFTPHMTLLRKVHRARKEPSFPCFSWRVSDFVLVRSDTLPAGAEYTVLRRWPLC